jgi:hypothetical protein
MQRRCYCSGYDEKDDDCAKKLMAAVLSGRIPIDWDEARRIAACPKYNCLPEFEAVKAEVEAELAKSRFELLWPMTPSPLKTSPGAHLDLGAVAGGPCRAAAAGESRGAEKHPAEEERGG